MKRMFTLIFLFISQSLACNITHIARIAREVVKSASPASTQKLLGKLKHIQAKDLTCTKTLFCTISALLKSPTHVQTHGKAIPASFILFSVPGYQETLRYIVANANNESIVKGYTYEIERALTLHQDGHNILHFHFILTDGQKWREIDLHTDRYMIECKNIQWSNFHNEKLCQQFCDQKRLVDHYNHLHNCSCTYQVSSKHPIPDRWRSWFIQEGISTYESRIQ